MRLSRRRALRRRHPRSHPHAGSGRRSADHRWLPAAEPRAFGLRRSPWGAPRRRTAGRTRPTSLELAPASCVTNEGGEGRGCLDHPARLRCRRRRGDGALRRGAHRRCGNLPRQRLHRRPLHHPGGRRVSSRARRAWTLGRGTSPFAGSSDYELGFARRGLTAKQTVGSYGTVRDAGRLGSRIGPHTFAAAEYAQSNGCGETERFSAGRRSRGRGRFGDRGLWRVTGQACSVVSQAAGVIREGRLRGGSHRIPQRIDPTRADRRALGSLRTSRRAAATLFTQRLFLIDRSVRIREDFTGYVTDTGTADPPVTCVAAPGSSDMPQVYEDPRGTMLDLAMNEQSLGVEDQRARTSRRSGSHRSWNRLLRAWRHCRQLPEPRRSRHAGSVATNASLSGVLGDLALYADTSLKPVSWVTLRGGVREELFTYDVEDHVRRLPHVRRRCLPSGNPRTASPTAPSCHALRCSSARSTASRSPAATGVKSARLAIDEVTAVPAPSLATISSYEAASGTADQPSRHALAELGLLPARGIKSRIR